MTAAVRIEVLGPTELKVRGTAVGRRSSRQRRLLAVLALHRGATVSLDRLAEAVWGNKLPADPAAAMQNQVARLRAVAGCMADVIETAPGGYRLTREVDTDVDEFEEILRSSRSQDGPEQRARRLERGVALWRGAAYEDLDVDGARAEAVRLEELRTAAEEARGAALIDAGRWEDAIALLKGLCAKQPLREQARLVLAGALASMGRRADALRTLSDLRRRLVSDLGLDPSPEFVRVERMILDTPVVDALTRPVGVSTPLSPVFGRHDDVRDVDSLLDSFRVVTLVGPGGVGKTTLALHVLERAAHRYQHDAVLVDLANANEEREVPLVVARRLAIDRRGDIDWVKRISEALVGRDMLIVLDNAEHVLDATARLVHEIVSTTNNHVLVTSRAPLSIAGERIRVVEPLEATDSASPAVRLFFERAGAARADWAPTDDELDLVMDICTRLDGLPIAIELAAAQLRYRTLRELADSVHRPLDALRGQTRSHRRHRGLRALLDWSYELLEPALRQVFDRLGVFSGGFILANGYAVCHDLAADISAFDEALRELVDRSLLRREDRPYGTRFRMLEIMRLYALGHLDASGAREDVQAAHAAATVDLVERGVGAAFSFEEPIWVALFDDERANVLAAHRWLMDQGSVEPLLRLACGAYQISFPRGRVEVAGLPHDALNALHRSGPLDAQMAPIAAEALGFAADAAVVGGDLEVAKAHVTRGLALASNGGGADRFCLFVAADLALFAGDTIRASALYRTAEAGLIAHGEHALAAWAAAAAALAGAYGAQPDSQVGTALEALERAQTQGCSSARAFCRYVVAEVTAQHDPHAALGQLEQAVADAESVDAGYIAGLARLSLATLSAHLGDARAAAVHYQALIDLWRRMGNWTQQWNTLWTLVVLLTDIGQVAEASTLLAAIEAFAPVKPWGADAVALERVAGVIRETLDPIAYEETRLQGWSLSPSEVLLLAEDALETAAQPRPTGES